jgi:secondary thiamine-phosphate synthase enzyme
MIVQHPIEIVTRGRGAHLITDAVQKLVESSGVQIGLCHLFLQHTSASIILCENADPDVIRDLEAFTERFIPDGDPLYRHTMEGPDDMPAHVRTVLTGSDLTIPITDRKSALGVWQGIYLWEHRHRSHRRKIVLTINGV